MNKILRSLRKKFPKVNFTFAGESENGNYKYIEVDKFILLDRALIVRGKRLQKQYGIKFIIVFNK